MKHDRKIKISTANSRKSTNWKATELLWGDFVKQLETPQRSTETLEAYLRLPKSQQDDLKDVGGFVGGTFDGLQRKANKVMGRDIVTLDLDNIGAGDTQSVLKRIEGLGCGYCVYSTRKHEESRPRLRVLIPLSRTAKPDEYEPLARKLGEIIGIQLCDPSTFEASRLMYYPSVCADSRYVFHYADKALADVDGILRLYENWRDVSKWARVQGETKTYARLAAKQQDPLEKSGVVGAFCKTYSIVDAMQTFLAGVYEPCDGDPTRFSYTGGSTFGGAILYEDKWLYSHHATDPAGGVLANAFDLVRLHKFADLDVEAKPDTPTNKLPSYAAMLKFAVESGGIGEILDQERLEQARAEFENMTQQSEAADADTDEGDKDVKITLKRNGNGSIEKSIDNIILILENDPNLKGKIAYDFFLNKELVLGALPWDPKTHTRQWEDNDDAGLRHYLERLYEISAKEKILDAVSIVAHKNKRHAVREYLNSLPEWDKTPRVDTLLIDYFGAADNVYTRTAMRMCLCAAVARVMEVDVKFDTMMIIAGAQGIGKSTFLKILGGKDWFTDSLTSFEGKEAYEVINGKWIVEVGELNAMSKYEINAVKQFLSKTCDNYRKAYGRRVRDVYRQCVFFGTTNDREFLRDRTGNRRFLPIDAGATKPTKNVFTELQGERDQIWAEALALYRAGEPLFLSGEAEEISKETQKEHTEHSAKEGLIREFLDKKVPKDWANYTKEQRRVYWQNAELTTDVELVDRDSISAVELWVECFGGNSNYMKQADTREINSILDHIEGWERKALRTRAYGQQRGYARVVTL